MKVVISAVLLLVLAASCLRAFSLDPVRIHYGGIFTDSKGEPVTKAFPAVFSVWQGGTYRELDSGKLLYKEKATIQPSEIGKIVHWLGSDGAEKLVGDLRGAEFGLDKTLYIQMTYTLEGKEKTVRKSLEAIDDAYIATVPASEQNRSVFRYKPWEYKPEFKEFSPDLVRKGTAILYPDFRIQREDGSFMETTGSKTSGVQELLDYCSSHHVDGYVVGGSVANAQQVIYRMTAPVHVHPAQGFNFETGAVLFLFEDMGDQPGFTVDSCMMVNIDIRGLIVYRGTGYAVSFNPTNLLPLDTFVGPTQVDSSYRILSIATRGNGVEFKGSINYCSFSCNELNGGDVGVHVDPGCGFSNNRFTCKHVHGQNKVGMLIESGLANVWEINYNPDARDPYPIKTSAKNEIWFANVHARSKPGLTLEPKASGNQFHLMGLTNSFDNRAATPTNRIYLSQDAAPTSCKLGFAVKTPAVPASETALQNRNPFPVIVMVHDPASVTGWKLTDSYGMSDSIDAPLTAGQSITLMPAESITLHYEGKAPTWRWRATQ